MILVDANVLMYAAGSDHPHKNPSVNFVKRVAAGDIDAAIDAEILQEILHRYQAINRLDDGCRLYGLARGLFPLVIPITEKTTDEARGLLAECGLSARDALHAAVSRLHSIDAICSYDTDFDRLGWLRRRQPEQI